jgi:hypothetical protein
MEQGKGTRQTGAGQVIKQVGRGRFKQVKQVRSGRSGLIAKR